MAIRIANIKTWEPRAGEAAFYVGRPSSNVPEGVIQLRSLGQEKDMTLETYQIVLNDGIIHNDAVKQELEVIVEAHKSSNVCLLCWCWPQPCHAEIVRDAVLQIQGLDTRIIQAIEEDRKYDTAVFLGAIDEEVDEQVDKMIDEEEDKNDSEDM